MEVKSNGRWKCKGWPALTTSLKAGLGGSIGEADGGKEGDVAEELADGASGRSDTESAAVESSQQAL